jgi:excisionase family DNA binding protein
MLTEALYTVDEAAEQLRLSPWTIWDLMKRGELVRTKVSGKTFLRESELQKLIVDHVNPRRSAGKKRKVEAR